MELTEAQLEQANQVVDDYISMLRRKQSSIIEIDVYGDPEVNAWNGLVYDCYVSRKDRSHPAQIYVLMDSEGDFYVDHMWYF